jgi:hypothetical protein
MNKDLHLNPLDFPFPFTFLLFLLFSNVLDSCSRNVILLFLYTFCSERRPSARPLWKWHRLSTPVVRADTVESVDPAPDRMDWEPLPCWKR